MKENLIPLVAEVNTKDDFWNSSETDCSLGDKDFTGGNKNDAIDSVELCAMTKELFENDTDFYTDKVVTECHLPELIVCYNDSTYNNVVKDICIDDGAHSEKKILIQDDLNGIKSKSSSEECYDECGDIDKEGVDGLKSPTVKYSSGDDIDQKSSSESDSDNDACCSCGPADQLQMNEENESAIEKSVEVTLRDELLPQTSLKSLLESSDVAEEHSCQIRHEEAITKDPVPIPASEESNKSVGPEDVNKQPIKLPIKDGILDNISVGNKLQHEEGESSFSVAVPNSGVITYSGPIIYSGSVSLRSDSSTTSTRSFAFPVLPNEWNSSPIRMAKAERGYFRRHRRWKQGLLCCKF